MLSSAHDLADGGLAQALVESCLRHDHGVEVNLPEDPEPFVALFSESSGRVLVSVKPGAVDDLTALCDEIGIERHRLGTVGERRHGRDPDGHRPVQPASGRAARGLVRDAPGGLRRLTLADLSD